MKKIVLIFSLLALINTLYAYEVYKGNIYPGAVNHQNSSLSCGLFSLNTMESSAGKISIKQTLPFTKEEILHQYTYDSQGRLLSFSNGKETYSYEYREEKLNKVKWNGKDIYFPTPYFISIRKSGDELNMDVEADEEGHVSAFILNDQNGTKYFFSEGRLNAVESIGTSDDGFATTYQYDEKGRLRQFRKETSEGKGESKIKTLYTFTYEADQIIDYLYEKSGPGRSFERTHCTFEYLDGTGGRIDTAFAIDDDGNIYATAQYEYSGSDTYTLKIMDSRNRLIEQIEVSTN